MAAKRVCGGVCRGVRFCGLPLLLAVICLCGCGQSQQQLEQARRALELHSRGIALLENKEWLEADAALEQLTVLLPEALVPARNLAVARLLALTDRETPYSESKDAEKFLAALQQAEATVARYRELAARANSDEQSIAAMLAGKLAAFQDSPERPTIAGGLEQLREAIRLSGDRPEMWYALALAMDGHRDYSDSAELIEVLQKTASLVPENLAIVTRLLEKQGLAANSPDPELRAAAASLPQTLERAAELLQPLNEAIKKQNRVDIVDVLKQAVAGAAPGELSGLMGPAMMAKNLLVPELAQQIDMRRINLNLLEYVQLELRPELGLSAKSLEMLGGVQQPTVLQPFVPGPALPPGGVTGRFQMVDMDLNGVDDLVWLDSGKLRVSATVDESGWVDMCQAAEGLLADGFVLADLDRDFDRAKLADVKSAAVLLDPDGDRRTVPQLAGENRWYDADHDVVLWNSGGVSVLRNERAPDGTRSLQLLPGTPTVTGVRAACVADLEADGDLDIVWGSAAGLVLWRNLDGTSFETVSVGVAGPGSGVRDVVTVDWNRDLAMDVVAVLDDGTVGVLENLLHSRFRWVALEGVNAGAECADVVVGEFNRDGFWDLATASGGVLRVWLSAGRGRLSAAVPVSQQDGRFTRLTSADLDNDGVTDLLAGHTAQTLLLRGAADGSFSALTQLLPVGLSTVALEVSDLDRDGDLDLLAAVPGGAERGGGSLLQSYRNEGGDRNNWIEIVPRAIGEDSQFPSNRVNMHAVGAVLEVRAGTNWQALVIDQPRLHVGLGSAERADAARVIWTDGVPQNITDLKLLRSRLAILAPQILLGSCPYIYTWNGERFEFFSDCLWAAPLGLVQASGEMAPIREWEYLLVPGRSLRPRDGRYVLQLTEELWEAAYFDEVQLLAVDHPADVQVFTNEKVGGPDIAAHRIHTVQRPRLPISVVDARGRDLLPGLRQQDQQYVQPFERRIVQGLTDEWTMEFDLGDLASEAPLREPRLVLTGWVFPTDTSINEAIQQDGRLAVPAAPCVEVPDGAGGWRVVRPFIGFPSGKTKAMVVDLEGVVSASNSKLRLRSSMELYWDAAFFMVNEPEVQPVLQACSLLAADLHYRGFSQRVYGPESVFRGGAGPEGYDYERVVREPRWSEMSGRFTRYGDVSKLLVKQDDWMIVMGPGDEVTVEFEVPASEPPPGWVRDFVLYNVGWDKDANLNTVYGQTSEPYPTGGMRRYPGDPRVMGELDAGRRRWLDEYQVREYRPYQFRDVLRRGGRLESGAPERR